MFIWQALQTYFHVIFIFQSVFQHIKLQDTYNTYNDLLHASHKLLENLDGTFLGNLVDTFDKLLSLHAVHEAHPGKMLRCEGGNPLIGIFFPRRTYRISDGENARIKDTDNVACIGFLHHMPV